MDKEELLRRLSATFLEELEEHVEVLERTLTELESCSDDIGKIAAARSAMRTAHTLKGAAGSMGFDVILRGCHSLEDVLQGIVDGTIECDRTLFEVLFSTCVALRESGEACRSGASLEGSRLAQLMPALRALVSGENATPPAAAASASNADEKEGRSMEAGAQLPLDPVQAAEKGKAAIAPSDAIQESAAVPQKRESVRLNAATLETMLELESELFTARSRLDTIEKTLSELRTLAAACRDASRDDSVHGGRPVAAVFAKDLDVGLRHLSRRFADDLGRLRQVAAPLEAAIRQAGMLPFLDISHALERATLDLARQFGKRIAFVVTGGHVEFDRAVLEALRSPLLHLIRNAVDHGIELPDERRKAGKSDTAQVSINIILHGSHAEIVVSDDGRGFDGEAIFKRAKAMNVPEPASGWNSIDLAFTPGLSVAESVSDVSGRGVGMDAVKTTVESWRGSISVASRPGEGTQVLLDLPITFSSLHVILVKAGAQTIAIESFRVLGLRRIDINSLHVFDGHESVLIDGRAMPIVHLAGLIDQQGHRMNITRGGGKLMIVALTTPRGQIAVIIDELIAERTVIVRPLGRRLAAVKSVAGATILPDGRIALVLNAVHAVEKALGRSFVNTIDGAIAEMNDTPVKKLLVVEDSVTTRTLTKNILESAGYNVVTAVNGREGWDILQGGGIDVVVSDVEMPVMDGFALTETIRASNRFRKMPVILVTGLETDSDKVRGMDAGADAYLLKSGFDQTKLIETIEQVS